MSERFYLNSPLTPGPVDLVGPEAHHLAVVCRLRPDDEVCLFNGDGSEYPARVVSADKRSVQLEVLAVHKPLRELPFALEVAAPVPKGDRGQFLVEKLTELGVTSFVPLLCARSVIHPREGKLDKLQRYVVEASKQCGRNTLMHVAAPATWQEYCVGGESGDLRLLGHLHADVGLSDRQPNGTRKVRCAVGPEGGFSSEEISLAQAVGWKLVNLGPRVLRIETAALAFAVAVIAGREQG